MSKARVLVNTISLSSGALRRERHIVRGLATTANDIDVHVLAKPEVAAELRHVAGLTVVEASHPDGTAGRIAWENTALPYHARRREADVLYFPLHITNLVDVSPKVAAIRNAAPFYPEAHDGASRRYRFRLKFLRAATRHTVRRSDRVVFMSETTRDRVASVVPAAAEKGVVIPHGVPAGFEPVTDTAAVRERYDLPDQFLLSVSNVSRYKNLIELVDGYAAAASQVDLPPLAIAGKVVDRAYARDLRERIDRHDLSDRVRLLGFVDHADLPALHSTSSMFVFSSACENAPLSLIEALACGDPIATSDRASMPELCGDAAAYFDPYDPASIGETIVYLWNDPERRDALSQAALARADDLSWDRAAERTSTLLASVTR